MEHDLITTQDKGQTPIQTKNKRTDYLIDHYLGEHKLRFKSYKII